MFMNVDELKFKIKTPEYDFLRTDARLGNNLLLLGVGGTYAYGVEDDDSDLNIIGITLNSKKEVLTGRNFERFFDPATEAVIFSFSKVISLLLAGNPATVEMLGLKDDHYIYMSPIAHELLYSRKIFLSKKVVDAYEKFIRKSLYAIKQKSDGANIRRDMEKLVVDNMNAIRSDLGSKYAKLPSDSIYLYLDDVGNNAGTDIFMDVSLSHYPLRDYVSLLEDLHTMVDSFGKPGRRKGDALTLDNISKHCMHLVRQYLTLFDILERQDIITYRGADRKLLMEIKRGRFLDSDGKPDKEFFKLIEDFDKRLAVLKATTKLPDEPNNNMIDNFVMSVNERIIRGEI